MDYLPTFALKITYTCRLKYTIYGAFGIGWLLQDIKNGTPKPSSWNSLGFLLAEPKLSRTMGSASNLKGLQLPGEGEEFLLLDD